MGTSIHTSLHISFVTSSIQSPLQTSPAAQLCLTDPRKPANPSPKCLSLPKNPKPYTCVTAFVHNSAPVSKSRPTRTTPTVSGQRQVDPGPVCLLCIRRQHPATCSNLSKHLISLANSNNLT